MAVLWWWMCGVAAVVALAVVAIWLRAMGRRSPLDDQAAQRVARRWIVGGGVLLPATAIAALLVFGTSAGRHRLPWPAHVGDEPLRIVVIGHRWWWELHYPQGGQRLVNELRLPAGRPVLVHTRSSDVIHSFWVPRLGGKLDAIPGRTLAMRLQADEPGSFLGQCAEFCGEGHAHMVMRVRVMPAAEFDAWLADGVRH